MLRALLRAWGFVVLLVPRRVVETFEPIAFENPDDAELRYWTIPIARLEGLLFIVLANRDEPGDGLSKFFGLVGLPAFFAPERYLEWGLSIAYENPEDVEVKSWVVPLTRVLGAVYLLIAIRGLLSDDDAADDAGQDETVAVEN
jgi:hypothetical protein